MKNFLQNLSFKAQNFLHTRYGTDQLSRFLTYAAFPLLLLGMLIPYMQWMVFLAYICIFWSMFRMLSKNPAARRKENAWFLEKSAPISRYCRQAMARFKNRKEYKYFRCPKCHSMLKLKRGAGEGTVTCKKCGNQFKKKA